MVKEKETKKPSNIEEGHATFIGLMGRLVRQN